MLSIAKSTKKIMPILSMGIYSTTINIDPGTQQRRHGIQLDTSCNR
jgi:hypothetical protein